MAYGADRPVCPVGSGSVAAAENMERVHLVETGRGRHREEVGLSRACPMPTTAVSRPRRTHRGGRVGAESCGTGRRGRGSGNRGQGGVEGAVASASNVGQA